MFILIWCDWTWLKTPTFLVCCYYVFFSFIQARKYTQCCTADADSKRFIFPLNRRNCLAAVVRNLKIFPFEQRNSFISCNVVIVVFLYLIIIFIVLIIIWTKQKYKLRVKMFDFDYYKNCWITWIIHGKKLFQL